MKRRAAPAANILDVLPVELRRAASPERCVCPGCQPTMSDADREHHQATVRAWCAARKAWCAANDYALVELLVAEHPRPTPSKRRSPTNPDGDRRPGQAITE